MPAFHKETIHLDYPVFNGDTVINTLTLTEPDVDGIEQLEDLGVFAAKEPLKDEFGKVLKDDDGQDLYPPLKVREIKAMVAVIGDMPADLIGKMHPRDFNKIGGRLVPLLSEAGGGEPGKPGSKT